jgi:hypothetical protein
MTRRAERLAEFLTNAGWEVFNTYHKGFCKECCSLVTFGKFCQECGTKALDNGNDEENDVLDFLENALKYALRVDKPAKSDYANGVDPGSFCG